MDKTRRLILALTALTITSHKSAVAATPKELVQIDRSLINRLIDILESVPERSALSVQTLASRKELKGIDLASIENALQILMYEGQIRRKGDGSVGSPFLYYVAETGLP
jgi:hypothetical protein